MKHLLFQLSIGLPFLQAAALFAADTTPEFRAVDVDQKVGVGYGVALADVDGDGKTDILLVDQHQVSWYRNPAWEKFVMVENLTPRDHVCIAAKDIDGDGKAEVAVGAGWNPGDTIGSGAVFYLVPPEDRTARWEPVALPHEPTVHRMRWVRNWRGEEELVVVPLHGRGNKNGEGAGVRILAYQKPADPHSEWTTRVLADSLHKTHNIDPVQWDDDRAEELLIASAEGVFLLNWVDQALKLAPLAGNEGGGAGEVRLGHLPAGKRFVAAIEPMHGNALVIYTPPPSDDAAHWDRQVIDDSLIDGHALACGDLLGLGRDQVVVGWRAMGKPDARVGIRLFIPLDSQGKEWRKATVDDNTMACEDLRLADLDGDGRLDIVAAGRASHNLKIYFNHHQQGR